jgi:hypothetical protein
MVRVLKYLTARDDVTIKNDVCPFFLKRVWEDWKKVDKNERVDSMVQSFIVNCNVGKEGICISEMQDGSTTAGLSMSKGMGGTSSRIRFL